MNDTKRRCAPGARKADVPKVPRPAFPNPEEFAHRGPVIELPQRERVIRLGHGETMPWPHERAIDPDVARLRDLALDFVTRARETRAPWLVAIAHILGASTQALLRSDLAALDSPHRWARGRLRDSTSGWIEHPSGEKTAVSPGIFYVPVEDTKRVLSKNPLPPGYDRLCAVLTTALVECRRAQRPLIDCTELIATCMMTSFPGLKSLNDPSLDYERQFDAIAKRLAPKLAKLSARFSEAVRPRDGTGARRAEATATKSIPGVAMAPLIAEELLRGELLLSGRSDDAANRELDSFLKMRAKRAREK